MFYIQKILNPNFTDKSDVISQSDVIIDNKGNITIDKAIFDDSEVIEKTNLIIIDIYIRNNFKMLSLIDVYSQESFYFRNESISDCHIEILKLLKIGSIVNIKYTGEKYHHILQSITINNNKIDNIGGKQLINPIDKETYFKLYQIQEEILLNQKCISKLYLQSTSNELNLSISKLFQNNFHINNNINNLQEEITTLQNKINNLKYRFNSLITINVN